MMMIVVARGGGEECNNSRFLILPERSVPNLASKVLRLTLGRLATDWQSKGEAQGTSRPRSRITSGSNWRHLNRPATEGRAFLFLMD